MLEMFMLKQMWHLGDKCLRVRVEGEGYLSISNIIFYAILISIKKVFSFFFKFELNSVCRYLFIRSENK